MQKRDKKTAKKVLYKHRNSAAAENPDEIKLRYFTGQAKLFLAASEGFGLLNDSVFGRQF